MYDDEVDRRLWLVLVLSRTCALRLRVVYPPHLQMLVCYEAGEKCLTSPGFFYQGATSVPSVMSGNSLTRNALCAKTDFLGIIMGSVIYSLTEMEGTQ